MFSKKVKQDAEAYFGSPVTEAVITVPAYFNSTQKQATQDAGKIAGLNVKRIMNEPTAAALAYGLNTNKGQTVAVYDLGAGTFDISILQISQDGIFEVKATNGDTFLGGEDFDAVLQKYILQDFQKTNQIDLSSNPEAMQRIKEAVERAKRDLSVMKSSEINLPFIAVTPSGSKNMKIRLTRDLFENLSEHLIRKTFDPITNCLKDAKLTPKGIDEVILVGGMTRMPKVIDSVREFFQKEPFRGVNPDEVVALGAAIQGSILSGGDLNGTLIDIVPISVGIETAGGIFAKLIQRNTAIPCKSTQTFSTAVDGQTHVDIKVFQGEREIVAGNKLLGQFTLSGVPPAPKGVPKIEVSFQIDVNSILTVHAQDKQSGKQQTITIANTGGLTSEEIKSMIEDAKKHLEEDKRTRQELERKLDIEQNISSIEQSIEQNEKKIPVKLLSDLREALKKTKDAIATNDSGLIEVKFEELKKLSLDIYSAINTGNQKEKPP